MSSADNTCVAALSGKRPADGPSDDESLPRDGEPTLSEQRPLAGSNVAASVAGSVAASVADSVAASVADSVAAASVEAGFDASDLNATDPQPWAVLALDVETHGWAERPPDPYINKMHRGQFGKVRFSDVQLNLTFAHLVQVGWCAFAANGDVLRRQELCVCDAPSCQQRAIDVHGLTDLMLAERGVPLTAVLLVAHAMGFDGGTLLCEYERAGCDEDAALLTGLATAGVCTMHAAAAQQQGDLVSRSEAQLRNPGFRCKYPTIPEGLSTRRESGCRHHEGGGTVGECQHEASSLEKATGPLLTIQRESGTLDALTPPPATQLSWRED